MTFHNFGPKKILRLGPGWPGIIMDKKKIRFFGLRISQFEKINEKKISKIFIFFRKNVRSRDLAMEIFQSKFFYCIFGIRMLQFVKKKQKFFFDFFDPRGLTIYDVINGMCPDLRVKDMFEVGVTYMVRKVFSRAIFWEIFSKILRLKLEQ